MNVTSREPPGSAVRGASGRQVNAALAQPLWSAISPAATATLGSKPLAARTFLALRLEVWILLVAALLVSCGGGGAETPTSEPPPPLTRAQARAIDGIHDRIENLLLIEVVRPARSEVTEDDATRLSQRLRIGLLLVRDVSTHHEHHYEVARTLGTIFATGVALGWPAASQLAEIFLQNAVAIDQSRADGWVSLGMLHLMTGDTTGAVHYLERARDLASSPQPTAQMALAQAYHLAGRQDEAVAALEEILQSSPTAELPRVLLELVELAAEEDEDVFRTPNAPVAEPYRPDPVVTAVAFPEVHYQNRKFGFSVRYPYDWTLHQEVADKELDRCVHVAEVALDLPLQTLPEEPPHARVRVIAWPVGADTTPRELAEERLQLLRNPQTLTEQVPIIDDSIQQHFAQDVGGRAREGEIVFVVRGAMGFVLQLSSTPSEFPVAREGFHRLLRSFSTQRPSRVLPPDCAQDAPI